MASEKGIKRFSASELTRMREKGKSLTDHARLGAMTDADSERSAMTDPDFRDVPPNWHAAAVAVMPVEKRLVSLRLDRDVIEQFRSEGPGYQTRINAVLRAYLDHLRQKTGGTTPAE